MVCRAAEHPSIYPSSTTAGQASTLALTSKDAGDLLNDYKKKAVQLTRFVWILSSD